MLSVVNCGMIGTKVTSGVTNDMVASAKKNLSNWTITGEIENTFADGMNAVEFTNSGPPSVSNGFKQEFYNYTGILLSDENANYIANKWATVPTLKLYQCKMSNGYYYIFLDSLSDANDTAFLNSQQVYFSSSAYRTLYRPANQTFDEWTGPTYVGRIDAGYTNQFILPNYTTYQASLPSFSGNITTDFTVEDGKYYLIRFKACSPSGFVKGATDEFIFTSGSNSEVVNISNTASQTLADYEVMIEADGTTLSVEIDAEMFINSNGVELDVSDLRMYEIVSI